jgi:hypothetical protein
MKIKPLIEDYEGNALNNLVVQASSATPWGRATQRQLWLAVSLLQAIKVNHGAPLLPERGALELGAVKCGSSEVSNSRAPCRTSAGLFRPLILGKVPFRCDSHVNWICWGFIH